MTPLDAIELIRNKRRGAFNSVQLQYLIEDYKKRVKKNKKTTTEHKESLFNKLLKFGKRKE